MKIRCKYSGVEFRVEHFDNFHFANKHPIFEYSTRELLIKARDYGRMFFSETENKLLFLAIMYKTDVVEWEVTPNPAPKLIIRNMPNMFKLLGHIEKVETGTVMIPKYRITADNADLANVNIWLDRCFENIAEWLNPISRHHLMKKHMAREMILDRMIHSQLKRPGYATKLAEWAMDNGNVPASKREYWTTLFKLKDNEIYSVPISDLEELVTHMEFHLFATIGSLGITTHFGSSYADATLEHVRTILSKAKAGRLGELANGEFFSILDDQLDAKGNLIHSIEKHNATLAALTAPEQMPRKEDYEGKPMQYMKAKAAWNLAQSMAAKQIKITEAKTTLLNRIENNG